MRDGRRGAARRDAPRAGLDASTATSCAAAFTPRRGRSSLNTPHNPTGKVFSPDGARVRSRSSAASATSSASPTRSTSTSSTRAGTCRWRRCPGMRERTITISSFGKTFSLTGWKIGWAAAPPELAAAVRAAHQFITFATATPLQHGAAVALSRRARTTTGDLARGLPRASATIWSRELVAHRLPRPAPQGTYFVCADFRPFGFDDDQAFVPAPDREGRRRRDPAERVLRPSGARHAATCASRSARSARRSRGRASGDGWRGRAGAPEVALVQMDLAWEDVAENHRRARRHLEEARGEGARLALLPEMFCTGFSMDAGPRSRSRRAARPRPSCGRRRASSGSGSSRAFRRRGSRGRATWRSSPAPDGSADALREDPSVHLRRRAPRLRRRRPGRHGRRRGRCA